MRHPRLRPVHRSCWPTYDANPVVQQCCYSEKLEHWASGWIQPRNIQKMEVTWLHCQMTSGQRGWDAMKHPWLCEEEEEEGAERCADRASKPQFDTVAHFPLNPFSGPSQSRITANWQSRKFEVSSWHVCLSPSARRNNAESPGGGRCGDAVVSVTGPHRKFRSRHKRFYGLSAGRPGRVNNKQG